MNTSSRHAVAADHVFDGMVVHRNAAVVIEDGHVAGIVPRSDLPPAMTVRTLPDGAWLAPGFIDLQVNGGGDVLFNDAPTPASITAIAAAHRKFGTTGFLPTFISDTPDKTSDCDRGRRDACRSRSERAWHPPGGAVPVAREAGRARPPRVARAHRGGPEDAHPAAQGRDAGDARAGTGAGRFHQRN